jgi:hypothetical protein
VRAGPGQELSGDRRPCRGLAAGGPGPAGRDAAPAAAALRRPREKRIRTLIQELDAESLDQVIGGWLRALADAGRLEPLLTAIAIDGKWLRGVGDGQVKLLAAMLHEQKMIIAQHRIPDETTETTQVKELLEPVDLQNAAITADATHAQRETPEYIAGPGEEGGQESAYFLFVKGNQPGVQRAVFDLIQSAGEKPLTTSRSTTATAASSSGPCGLPTPGTWTSPGSTASRGSAATVTTSPAPSSPRRPSTPLPAWPRTRPAQRTSPPSAAASGVSSP